MLEKFTLNANNISFGLQSFKRKKS